MNIPFLYRKAIDKWGVESQVIMAYEEMSELMQALSKNYRGVKNVENIREEIADVEIMMGQLRVMFDAVDGGETIDEIKTRKLERLEELVEEKTQEAL